jgi:prepilin-type N-terminal cleavage/methylation domain-containing protein
MRHHSNGFTLVELSFVLAIIGFLVGVIFVGQSLIKSANMNSVLTDAAKYTDAFTNFRDKYQALPGDMPNAESYWGTPGGGCPAGAGTTKEVCNGNGDGVIFKINDAANAVERAVQWVELANSGMITGAYQYQGWFSFFPGLTMPRSSYNEGSFQAIYGPGAIFNTYIFPTIPQYNMHFLWFGRAITNYGIGLPIFSGLEALSIDIKIDDGNPATGKFRASRNTSLGGRTPSCLTTDVATTAAYNLTTSDPVCIVMFLMTQ